MSNNKPNFIVYGEVDRGRRKPQLIRIGAAWAHEKAPGFGVQIDSLPLNFNGRLVLFEPKDDANNGDPDTGGNYSGADEAYLLHNEQLMAALTELRGKDLESWCAPEACHGDVLLELANRSD